MNALTPAAAQSVPLSLDSLFCGLPIPIFVTDQDNRIAFVNEEFSRVFGWRESELINRNLAVLHERADLHRLVTVHGRLRRAELAVSEDSWQLRHRDGRLLQAQVRAKLVADANGRHLVGVVLSSHVSSSGTRTVSHDDLFRGLFDEAPIPITIQDEQYRIVDLNAAYEQWMGYSREELLGRDPIELTAPEMREEMIRGRASDRVQSLGRGVAVRRLRHRNGRDLHARIHFHVINNLNGSRFYLATIVDLSEDIELQRRLAQQVRRMEQFFELAPVGLMIRDQNQRIDRVNRAFTAMSGYSAEELKGRDTDLIPAGDEAARLAVGEAWREALQGDGSLGRARVPLLTRGDQPVFTDRVSAAIEDIDGNSVVLTAITDITEIKAYQDQLTRANAELGALVDNTAVAIAYLDGERLSRCNRPMQALLGGSSERLLGMTLGEFADPQDEACAQMLRSLSAQPRLPRTSAIRLRRLDGTEVACLMHLGPVDLAHASNASIAVAIDMSGQQAALSALAATQERFGRFAEAVDEAVFVIDAGRGLALFANRRFEQVLGVPADEFLSDPTAAWRHLTQADRVRVGDLLQAALNDGHQEADVQVALPDGRLRVLRLRFFPARLGSAEIYGLAEDVTQNRDLAERRLQDALRQKETLVREVHHRIKNNLQGVAGLLQQSAARRPEIAPQLDEIVGQIQAIAQVHGLQVRDKGALPLASLVLAVVENLSRGFGVTIRHDLRSAGPMQEWRVPEQEAVPVALVINELCTNAIKHRDGGDELRVELSRVDQSLMLVVCNHGRLKPGFSLDRFEPSPSGLGLIKALLPRRGTRLALRSLDGEVFSELQMWPPVIRFGDG